MAAGLAGAGGGVAAVHDRRLVVYDATGAPAAEHPLDRTGLAVARFGDEWLVLCEGEKGLARVGREGPPQPFAAGKAQIGAFAVGRDDAVAVARKGALELWSRDDRKKWSAKAGPFLRAAVVPDHVVALGSDGALFFFSRDGGAPLGALRLASPEPPETWQLAPVDGAVVVLTLGDWLVWIDATTRKTVRRVRARAKVLALAADADHVVAAVEDGSVQAFRAGSGEPRGSFAPQAGADAIALGEEALYALGSPPELGVEVCDRRTLDVTTRSASPISSLASRGRRVAVGDRSGRVRILESERDEMPELGAFSTGEAVLGLHVTKSDLVIAAGARMLVCVGPPTWQTPRPIALRAPPTAFAADDAYAFAGTQSGAVEVYDLASGRPVTSYTLSSDDRVTGLVRLGGVLLVVGLGALDGRVVVVDVADAKVLHRISPHDEAFGVTCLASDARGRIVASGSDDGSIALIDPQKGRILARLRVSETPTSMAFEPSGRRLACVFADGTAAVVTFTPKGATVSDLGLRGATNATWGEGLVFGFKDGHAESERLVTLAAAPPNPQPGAMRAARGNS